MFGRTAQFKWFGQKKLQEGRFVYGDISLNLGARVKVWQGFCFTVCDSMYNFRHPDLPWHTCCFTVRLNPHILFFAKIPEPLFSIEISPRVFWAHVQPLFQLLLLVTCSTCFIPFSEAVLPDKFPVSSQLFYVKRLQPVLTSLPYSCSSSLVGGGYFDHPLSWFWTSSTRSHQSILLFNENKHNMLSLHPLNNLGPSKSQGLVSLFVALLLHPLRQ